MEVLKGLTALKIRLKRVREFVENRRILDMGILLAILAVLLIGAGTTFAELSYRLEQRDLLEMSADSTEAKPSIAGAFLSAIESLTGQKDEKDDAKQELQSDEDEAEQED